MRVKQRIIALRMIQMEKVRPDFVREIGISTKMIIRKRKMMPQERLQKESYNWEVVEKYKG